MARRTSGNLLARRLHLNAPKMNRFSRSFRCLVGVLVAGSLLAAQPAAQPKPALGPGFRFGAGDVLSINVWHEPEASVASLVVRSDGMISLPLVKEVQAAGLTPAELEADLTKRLSRFIRDAEVVITVKEVHSQKIYLIGNVRTQGPQDAGTPMTVLQAIAAAGGLTDYAKRSKIYILRKEDGREQRLSFDYSAVIRGAHSEQNIMLRPGDTVVVP